MYLPFSNISFDELKSDLLSEKGIRLSVMRLDKIHPTVSGNKLFKLHFYVEACLASKHKTMLTFGGAYSNHLAATAFLCKEKGIKSIGIVRGEKPAILSHTLTQCINDGMILHFVSRNDYQNIETNDLKEQLKTTYGAFTYVPEGGFGNMGAKGAALIMNLLNDESTTHICTCVGTATTLAGLILNCREELNVIAVPVIKNMTDIENRIMQMTNSENRKKVTVFNEYHFGGYAKYNNELITFMNNFYTQYNVPTDFVYTAKMMYAIFDKIKQDEFMHGSNIVCIHTGGLQGNDSLTKGTLIF